MTGTPLKRCPCPPVLDDWIPLLGHYQFPELTVDDSGARARRAVAEPPGH